MAHYSKLKLKLELLSKLSLAQKQRAEGDTGKTLKQVMVKISEIINAKR
jgi:hypothetical protein